MAGESGVLRELLAIFGFSVDTSGLKDGENKLEAFAGKVKKLAEGLAAAFAIHEIADFVEHSVRAMTEIEHTANRLGVSTEKVQEFQFAAKSLGMESETLLNMMGRLQVTQQAAANGSEQASSAFSQLGTKVKDSNGHFKTADQLFLDVAEGISKVKDPSKQAALAVQLFGRQGRSILPFLKQGKGGVQELAATFRQLGGAYSTDAIEKSKEYEKESAKLDLVLTSLKSTLLQYLIPAFSWLAEKAQFVVVVFEDIIGMFEGKKSVTGEFIDKIFGKGSSADFVRAIRDIWHEIGREIELAYGWAKKFIEGAMSAGGWVGDTIGKISNNASMNSYEFSGGRERDRQASIARQQAEALKNGQIFIPPGASLGPSSSTHSNSNSVNVVVNAHTGASAKEIGAEVADQVDERIKLRHAAAARTFQRAPSTP